MQYATTFRSEKDFFVHAVMLSTRKAVFHAGSTGKIFFVCRLTECLIFPDIFAPTHAVLILKRRTRVAKIQTSLNINKIRIEKVFLESLYKENNQAFFKG